jgi:Hemerythrin HHE cation binding domain
LASRKQVRELISHGLGYREAGKRLGIPAGQAYLIATGMPADGGDAPPDQASRPVVLPASQHLVSPPHDNPTSSQTVLDWIAARVAADRPMRDAAARRTAEPEPPKSEDPEAGEFSRDVTVVLTRQHNQVRALLKQVQALPSHKTGGTAQDLSARKSIVNMITVRLAKHATAEAKYLWPTVRKAFPDGDALADHAARQEQESKDTLIALGKLDPNTDDFDEGVERLVAQLRKHVAYEAQMFTRLREALPDSERGRLGRHIEAAVKAGPMRPHRKPSQEARARGRSRSADREGTARTMSGDT